MSDLCEPLEIAGPGFINFRLRSDVLARAVTDQLAEPAVGVQATEPPKTVVIDYSAPNVAKQMHVGHLRTTIIGDCFNRVLTAVGHQVLPQNHIGDWGTQFGMLVEQVLEDGIDASALTLPEAEALYKRGIVPVPGGHATSPTAPGSGWSPCSPVTSRPGRIWRDLIDISLTGFNAAYDRLNVKLTDEHLAGESIYNDDLASVAAELEASGRRGHRPGCAGRLRRGLQRTDDRAQVRRRVRLLDHRPRRRPAPGPRPARRPDHLRDRRPAGRPLRPGVRGLPVGRLAARRRDRPARRVRHGARPGREAVQDP